MNTLELSDEDFRRLAASVVEVCAEYLSTLDGRSTFPVVTGAESERLFDLEIPERGMGDEALASLTDVIGTRAARTAVFSDTSTGPVSRSPRWATCWGRF